MNKEIRNQRKIDERRNSELDVYNSYSKTGQFKGRSKHYFFPFEIGLHFIFIIIVNLVIWPPFFLFNDWRGRLLLALFSIITTFLLLRQAISVIRKQYIDRKTIAIDITNFNLALSDLADYKYLYELKYYVTSPKTGKIEFQDIISENMYLILKTLKSLPAHLYIKKNHFLCKIDYKKIKKEYNNHNDSKKA